MYICYNKNKKEKLEFANYADVMFVGEFGMKIRELLATSWAGDGIAIFDEDGWQDVLPNAGPEDNPRGAKTIDVKTFDHVKSYYTHDRDYVTTGTGAFFDVKKDGTIRRFDSLIMLLALDLPEEYMEAYYYWLNGRWAFKPIEALEKEPKGKDISCDWDVEGFYRNYSDEDIKKAIKTGDVPEEGLWVVDIIGELEA